MEHLLFAAYLIFFAWLVTKTNFFTASGLMTPQLVIVFLLKVIAGIFYGWIGVYYGQLGQMMDTWVYHYESLKECRLLQSHPGEFFTSLFQTNYADGYSGFLSEKSWWNDVKSNSYIKFMAVFNLLSFGNYYINVIFYSFITMFGPLALYRVMNDVFPARRLPVLLATFLVPSVLYWTSGLHKDGLLFLGLCMVVYGMYRVLKTNRVTIVRILAILLGLLLVLLLRNFLIVPLVPALLAWVLAARLSKNPLLVFGVVYAFFILLFFSTRYLSPKLDFPQDVVNRQEAFLSLGGGSAVAVKKLEPTVGSFLVNAPAALALSVLRPYPSDVRHLLSLAASCEINFLLLLFLAFLLLRRKGSAPHPFLVFCVFFSFSVLLMIGYSVNVLGAVVRYRSIVLSFLVIPLAARLDWPRIGRLFFGDIQNK